MAVPPVNLDFITSLAEELDHPEEKWRDVYEHEFIAAGLELAVRHFTGQEVDYRLWNGLAGNTNCGVRVHNAAGQFLYVTPPLFNTGTLEIGNGGFLAASEQIELAKRNNMPHEHHLSDQLNAEGNVSISMHDYTPSLITWLRIFTLYGIKMEILDPEEPAKLTLTEEPEFSTIETTETMC